MLDFLGESRRRGAAWSAPSSRCSPMAAQLTPDLGGSGTTESVTDSVVGANRGLTVVDSPEPGLRDAPTAERRWFDSSAAHPSLRKSIILRVHFAAESGCWHIH